jgi:hypothetical protein
MSFLTDDPLGHVRYRLGCIKRKLKATAPSVIERVRPLVMTRGTRVGGLEYDFSGGLSNDQIREIISALIYEVAHVKDPLKSWMAQRGRNAQTIENFIDQSRNLQIVIDLANADKHGTEAPNADKRTKRRRTRCPERPRLAHVSKPARLSVGPAPCPSSATMLLTPRGPVVHTEGDASVDVAFRGSVAAESGQVLGEVLEIVRGAVADWERLLSDLGIG